MRTRTFHKTNMGSFAGGLVTDMDGYVLIHDSGRYSRATAEQLTEWAESGHVLAVRNAAQTELNERELAVWRNK